MYENNKEICDALNPLMSEKLCAEIFRTRPHKAWQSWQRYGSGDMQKFMSVIPVEQKLELYRWIHIHILRLLPSMNLTVNENSPKLHRKIQETFNEVVCKTLFHRDAERVWRTWEVCGNDACKFIQSMNVKDKWCLLLSYHEPENEPENEPEEELTVEPEVQEEVMEEVKPEVQEEVMEEVKPEVQEETCQCKCECKWCGQVCHQ